MKERRSRASKVHFQHNGNHRTLCGLDGRTTYIANSMTCRVCMFHYLAESASWARRFLDDLRGKPTVQAGRDQTPPESQRDKDLRERGYHVSVGPAEYGDRNVRRSPRVVLEYIDAEAVRANVRAVVGPAALGELGPLTPEQEADVERFGDYVRRTREQFVPLGRELAGTGQGHTVAVPAGATTPVNGQEKGLGNGFARAFGYKGDPQKAIRELLTVWPPFTAAVQPVMERSGAAADAIGVKEGDVAEQSGDAGQVGYKPDRYRKASE